MAFLCQFSLRGDHGQEGGGSAVNRDPNTPPKNLGTTAVMIIILPYLTGWYELQSRRIYRPQ